MVPRPKGEESEACNRAAFADLWLAANQLGEPRGYVPSVARRKPEKERQGAPMKSGRPSEGGKRSCFPSEQSLGQKRRVFKTPSLIHNKAFHYGKKMLSFHSKS